MRKPDWFRRARPEARDDNTPGIDIAAVSLAVWLGLLVGVKFVERLPPLPPAPVAAGTADADAWTMSAFGT